MIRNEKGNALIFVIIVLAVLIILAPVIVLAANTELKQTKSYENRTQAYYYARSGMESALEWLVNDNRFNEEFDGEEFISGTMGEEGLDLFDTQPIDPDEIDVTMKWLENGNGVRIVSTGTFNGLSKKLTLIINTTLINDNAFFISPFDKAVFVTNYLGGTDLLFSLHKGTGLDGDFGALINYDDLDVIDFQFDTIDWNEGDILYVYVSDDIDDSELDLDLLSFVDSEHLKIIRDEEIVYPPPIFPEFPPVYPDVVWQYDTYTGIIDFAANNRNYYFRTLSDTLIVNLGSESANIYADKIDLEGLIINNTGEGKKLNIFINDSIKVSGNNSLNEDGSISDLMIYYKGEEPPKIVGTTTVVGSIFTEISDFYVGGNYGFIGHLIMGSGDLYVTGNSDMFTRIIYAPTSYVDLNGNGTIKGSVIADRAVNWGSGQIIYDATDPVDFPWEIFDELPSGGTGGTTDWDTSKMITSYYWQ